MTPEILRCCENFPSFLIEYNIDSKFHVCNSCIKIDYWSRGIKEKRIITEFDDQGRSASNSVTELITNGKY